MTRRRARLSRLARRLVLGCAAVGLAATGLVVALPATADVVRTRDGLVLEGKTVRAADGSVSVETADGVVRLAAARVEAIEPGDGPRATLGREWAALGKADAKSDVDARFKFALRAEKAGAPDLAKTALESVVASDPDHAAARRALGFERSPSGWVSVAEANRLKGLVLFNGVWMLPLEAEAAAGSEKPVAIAADATLADVMRTAATAEPALARAAALRLAKAEPPARVATAIALLSGDKDAKVRTWAAGHLATAADETALRPLIKSAILDRDPGVRSEAVLAAMSFGNDDTAVPFVRALSSPHPSVVANAAGALASLNDPRSIVHLVKKIYSHSSGSRNVVEFLTKTSYIRDYDVEIAQASNIANPIIGTAVDGVVMDIKVVDVGMTSTVIESALVDAFNKMTGANAKNAGGVLEWYKAHVTTLSDFPAKPAPGRKVITTPR